MPVPFRDVSLLIHLQHFEQSSISSLNEYENLIGTLPTLGGPELTSYYAVKAFFQNAPQADLRVTRVGTPGVIQELAFSPAANKDNGVSIPSSLVAGDVVYAKLQINGKELGDRSPNGAWLGVPVTIPEPGLLNLDTGTGGYGGVFLRTENGLELVVPFSGEDPSGRLTLQPGRYVVMFRAKHATRTDLSLTRSVDIRPGGNHTLEF